MKYAFYAFALAVAACGGAISADPVPPPACVIEAGPVDCAANDCHALEHIDGGEIGTTVRGRCPEGDRCIVWIDTKATYGVCR